VYGPEWTVQEGALKVMVVRPIQRLGSLVFATEYREGKHAVDRRGSVMRFGASATKRGFPPFERYGQPFGPTKRSKKVRAAIGKTNDHYADMLGTSPFLYIKGRRLYPSDHEPRDEQPEDERSDDDQYDGNYDGDGDYDDDDRPKPKLAPELRGNVPLAEARAWAGLPPAVPANDNRPALPCGADGSVADAFVGMRATGVDQSGTPAEDPWVRLHELPFLRGKLGLDHCRVLDLGIMAQSFGHLGEELGVSEKVAKRLLLKAIKKLEEIGAELPVG
jgi:hypothetical protein